MRRMVLSLFAIFVVLAIFQSIANVIITRQLNNTIQTLKEQGKLKTIGELKPPPVPGGENAATLYNKAFELMTTGEGGTPYIPGKTMGIPNKRFSDIRDFINEATPDSTKWTHEQERKLSEIVNAPDIKNLFSILEEAAKKTECNFNLEYEKGFELIYPPFGLIRAVEKLFSTRAIIEAREENISKALDTILTGLKVSNHFKYELMLIPQMFRISNDIILVDTLRNILNSKNIPADKMKSLMDELSHHKNLPWLTKAMDIEITGGMSAFDKLIEGKIRLSEFFTGETNLWLALYGSYPMKPMLKKDMETYLNLMLNLREQFMMPYHKIAKEIQNNSLEKQIPFYCVASKITIPNLQRIVRRAANHQAEIELARTALALKIYKTQHGIYPYTLTKLTPDILDKITDEPFSGRQFVYKKSGNGFILYSFGPNMKDDNGAPVEDTSLSMDTKGDIVWKSEN